MGATLLLSTAYLPPVAWMSRFRAGYRILIEDDENYIKQTYRNRCIIAGPNGLQTLSVPVVRASFHKTHIRDVAIDNKIPWQNNHLRSLKAAYQSSPYFEFFIHELTGILRHKTHWLIDLNHQLITFLLEQWQIENLPGYTGNFAPVDSNNPYDSRFNLAPKRRLEDPMFRPVDYPQVFREKYGFLPNLSAIDLLFNMGPDGSGILADSLKKI